MALKFLKKKTTKLKSFLREYSISLYLSPCPFIINMFGIAFETDEYYVFAQEYALAGDLFDIIPPQVHHLSCHSGERSFMSFCFGDGIFSKMQHGYDHDKILEHKDGQDENSLKVSPKNLGRPLVGGCGKDN